MGKHSAPTIICHFFLSRSMTRTGLVRRRRNPDSAKEDNSRTSTPSPIIGTSSCSSRVVTNYYLFRVRGFCTSAMVLVRRYWFPQLMFLSLRSTLKMRSWDQWRIWYFASRPSRCLGGPRGWPCILFKLRSCTAPATMPNMEKRPNVDGVRPNVNGV